MPLLTYWAPVTPRDARPKVAVFALVPEVDDGNRQYLAAALSDRVRARLEEEPRLRVATEGSVSRAMTNARARQDSAAILLGANFMVTGRLVIAGPRQEVETFLVRARSADTVWRAAFRATTSFRSVEEAIVRGVSRALGLTSPPALPAGWPVTDAGHEAVMAGDTFLRGGTPSAVDSAISHYERARLAEPASPVVLTRLALASVTLLEQGGQLRGYPGADGPRWVSELVSRAMGIDSSAEAWTVRAMLARYNDPVRFTGALDAHLRAVSRDPRDAAAQHEYGVTLRRLGDLRGAEERYRRALAISPSRASSLGELAWLDLQASRWQTACAFSNASIAAWPYDPLPYAIRAEARLRLADARDAYSDAELVGRLASGPWPDALRLLVAHGASNVDESRRQLQGLTGRWLAPGGQFSVRDAEYLAIAYLTMGDRRRAIEVLRRARPIGADLRAALTGPRLASIRADTAVVRLLQESQARERE